MCCAGLLQAGSCARWSAVLTFTASTTVNQVQVCRLSGHFVKPLWYVPLRDGHDPLPGMHANTHLAQVCAPLSISLQAVFCVVAPCLRSFLPCMK